MYTKRMDDTVSTYLIIQQPNIIPDRTEGYFYVRAKTTARVEELMVKVENCFKAAALATGCELEYKWRESGMCKGKETCGLAQELVADRASFLLNRHQAELGNGGNICKVL